MLTAHSLRIKSAHVAPHTGIPPGNAGVLRSRDDSLRPRLNHLNRTGKSLHHRANVSAGSPQERPCQLVGDGLARCRLSRLSGLSGLSSLGLRKKKLKDIDCRFHSPGFVFQDVFRDPWHISKSDYSTSICSSALPNMPVPSQLYTTVPAGAHCSPTTHSPIGSHKEGN